MALSIHNSLTRRLEPFEPIEPGHVRMYVCGITIYDLSHVGHARMLLAFDMVQRWLRARGWRVTYVRNITDIDDKIIRRAVERGITLRQLTTEMTARMHEDLAALAIEPPTHEPRATDYIPQMQALIGRLEQRGLAYAVPGGDVNFAVRRFPAYGRLSGKSLDQLRAGERVAVARDKDDPLDFVLWKAGKPEEPAEAHFASPWGEGRPGWHIECSAMSAALLGDSFDIHGGGQDLQFPHHENEIAQSEGASGRPLARVWMHNGLVNVDDTKMSKSLGNFFTIREVLERFDGETLRLFMLRSHYRSPVNYGDVALADARAALRRLYTALEPVVPQAPTAAEVQAPIDWAADAPARFAAAMDDDFNTPQALAVLFDLAGEVNRTRNPAAAHLLRRLGGCLGLLQADARTVLQDERAAPAAGLDAAAIEARIAARAAAKAARDFARADAIRAELSAAGVQLKDGPQGTRWVRA